MNDENVVLEVHKSQNNDYLWFNVGKIQENLDIEWGEAKRLPNDPQGFSPSVCFHGEL